MAEKWQFITKDEFNKLETVRKLVNPLVWKYAFGEIMMVGLERLKEMDFADYTSKDGITDDRQLFMVETYEAIEQIMEITKYSDMKIYAYIKNSDSLV